MPPDTHSITTIDTIAGARVTFTPGGLLIGQTLDAAQWREILTRLRTVKQTYQCYLADLIDYGNKHFGAEFVQGELRQLEFDLADVTHATAIGHTSLTLRNQRRLTSEHYYLLGRAFPDQPAQQDHWADLAIQHQLSPLALKRSLEAPDGPAVITDQQLADLSGRHSGQPVLHGVSLTVRQWVNGLGGEDKLLRASRAVREAFVSEITPIDDLYQKVRATL